MSCSVGTMWLFPKEFLYWINPKAYINSGPRYLDDADNDGIVNSMDNCWETYNPDQKVSYLSEQEIQEKNIDGKYERIFGDACVYCFKDGQRDRAGRISYDDFLRLTKHKKEKTQFKAFRDCYISREEKPFSIFLPMPNLKIKKSSQPIDIIHSDSDESLNKSNIATFHMKTIIIGFKENTSYKKMEKLARKINGRVISHVPDILVRIEVSIENQEELMRLIQKVSSYSNVEYVQQDYILEERGP